MILLNTWSLIPSTMIHILLTLLKIVLKLPAGRLMSLVTFQLRIHLILSFHSLQPQKLEFLAAVTHTHRATPQYCSHKLLI